MPFSKRQTFLLFIWVSSNCSVLKINFRLHYLRHSFIIKYGLLNLNFAKKRKFLFCSYTHIPTLDKQKKIINNKHVGRTLRKSKFLRVLLHTYNVRSAKINLAKSSSTTRAFIIVSNNNFMAYPLSDHVLHYLCIRGL